jgi:hypothetical protein
LATVFSQVAVIADRRTIDGEGGGNLVLVASDTPLDPAAVEAEISTWGEGESTVVLAAPDEVTTFIGSSAALTDDFAPVDQLLGR